ncbi:MAG: hypothetical protein COW71_16455 [Ignavibacteriales bacterium CG18_big_fil_WC_8_21_14_2_50_31_20]|nr:MAG: hypothetical protein COW71_16455 [Ignavibacteriales bacterium CG18_big_fil_WC_8_21_14_2_50_31_20]
MIILNFFKNYELMILLVEDKIIMIIQNELTINYATEIYNLLSEELKVEGDLKIEFESPTPIDVTFVQILHSFLAKCKSINKKVSIELKGKSEFVNTIKQMGYRDISEVLENISEQNGEDNA